MEQFFVNDMVRYGATGVCRIVAVTEQTIGKKRAAYYELQPVHQQALQIYLPCDNPQLVAKMQRVLSEKEIRQLIQSMPDENAAWIEDEQERKEHFKEILQSSDRARLIGMIRAIYLHGKACEQRGKRLHQSDEHFLEQAERLLNDEFAYVLHLKPDQVLPFIESQLDAVGA